MYQRRDNLFGLQDSESDRFSTYSEHDHIDQSSREFFYDVDFNEEPITIESRLRLPRRQKRNKFGRNQTNFQRGRT